LHNKANLSEFVHEHANLYANSLLCDDIVKGVDLTAQSGAKISTFVSQSVDKTTFGCHYGQESGAGCR